MEGDYERVSTYKGHITISAHDTVCGFKYKYIGINTGKNPALLRQRHASTTLRHIFLMDVKCENCKRMRYEELNQENEKG